jgi:UDP-N-acetylmuramoyl-L-alanyl-D-glutamate--2,6-diaminopimelate ligase
MRKLKLRDLVAGLPEQRVLGDPGTEVAGMAYHSRHVHEGFLFAAIRGLREDGKRFIPDALARGAKVLLTDEPWTSSPVIQVVVPDVREALARLAATFYGEPSSSLTLIGITGTNGKTTTAYLIESILQAEGKTVGVMGTINYRYGANVQPAPTTTPESLDLQRSLRAMADGGVTHVVLEVSSHALDLQRVRGCEFDVGLFTNLTRDHLDYHPSMQEYYQAKELLFTQCLGESCKEPRTAVINMDDPKGPDLVERACGRVLRYAVHSPAEIRPHSFQAGAEGLAVQIATPRGALAVNTPMIGQHNLYNVLAAVSVGEALGLSRGAMAAGIQKLQRVPGRMERVPAPPGLGVFVDYAHTPDALERALETLREIRAGRVIVVFGCGGDRDRGKRAAMGRVAAGGSDWVVLTSDNPRSEDPLRIIAEAEKGVREVVQARYDAEELFRPLPGPGYFVEPDRRKAIGLAIRLLRPGDVVLIAGKGHEDYQILGEKRIHFDDREEALAALAARAEGKEIESIGS